MNLDFLAAWKQLQVIKKLKFCLLNKLNRMEKNEEGKIPSTF